MAMRVYLALAFLAAAVTERGIAIRPPPTADLTASPIGATTSLPKLHVVTFMNKFSHDFAYLQVTAEVHGISPRVVGYGQNAWWPEGLGIKINALRNFTYGVDHQDIVLFMDAFDVMVFGDESEIVSAFLTVERRFKKSIIFNAEEACYPDMDGICDKETYPAAPHRWRFLNSGVVLGRASEMKKMLKDGAPDIVPGGDQMWYQKYFRSHRDAIHLDTECYVLCAVIGVNKEAGATLEDRRISILDTGTKPSVVHFPGPQKHMQISIDGKTTTTMQWVFSQLYPAESARLPLPSGIVVSFGPTWAPIVRSSCKFANEEGETRDCKHEYFLALPGICLLILLVSFWGAFLAGRNGLPLSSSQQVKLAQDRST